MLHALVRHVSASFIGETTLMELSHVSSEQAAEGFCNGRDDEGAGN